MSEKFGEKLRRIRTSKNMTQEELATVKGQADELRKLMAEESSFNKAAQGNESLAKLKVGGEAVAQEAKRLREEAE